MLTLTLTLTPIPTPTLPLPLPLPLTLTPTYAFHSRVTRKSIDALKEFFKEDVAKEDWQLLLRLKKMFGVL